MYMFYCMDYIFSVIKCHFSSIPLFAKSSFLLNEVCIIVNFRHVWSDSPFQQPKFKMTRKPLETQAFALDHGRTYFRKGLTVTEQSRLLNRSPSAYSC